MFFYKTNVRRKQFSYFTQAGVIQSHEFESKQSGITLSLLYICGRLKLRKQLLHLKYAC